MRAFLLAFAAIAISGPLPAAPTRPAGDMPVFDPGASESRSCPPISRFEAARHGGKLGPRNLGDLPGADLYKAVFRRVGRCQAPIIVRLNIGGASGAGSGKR